MSRLLATTDNLIVEDPHHDECDELLEWCKFLIVVAGAGTGKSFTLVKLIDACLSMTGNAFVATPMGYLATRFKGQFRDHINADSIHVALHYPVLE